MGLSETIVAAIIGALATMATAIVQLIRNRAPEGSKPKKNRVRSLVATIALMIGCVVGGYAWSSLKAVSAKEELRSTMKAEFAEQFATLAASQAAKAKEQEAAGALAARHGDTGTAESSVQGDGRQTGRRICPSKPGSRLARDLRNCSAWSAGSGRESGNICTGRPPAAPGAGRRWSCAAPRSVLPAGERC